MSSTPAKRRMSELDFTKGALVLVMVLYHWLNYFVNAYYVYRYLRFLTPSFIFITGFLISQVYLVKAHGPDASTWRRLIHRGLKILALFIVLNLARAVILERASASLTLDSLVGTLVSGNVVGGGAEKSVSFFILVPISYLLLLAAFLTVAVRYFKNAVHALCGLVFLSIIVLALYGKQSGVLELLGAGLLGASVGYIPMERIHAFAHKAWIIVPSYVAYLIAVSVWGEVYALQIAGVCLTLAVLYVMHGDSGGRDVFRQVVILLGRYSLLGYIGQIAVLQMLRRSIFRLDLGEITPYLALAAAVALTVLMVWVTDRARSKAAAIDRLYTAVFA